VLQTALFGGLLSVKGIIDNQFFEKVIKFARNKKRNRKILIIYEEETTRESF